MYRGLYTYIRWSVITLRSKIDVVPRTLYTSRVGRISEDTGKGLMVIRIVCSLRQRQISSHDVGCSTDTRKHTSKHTTEHADGCKHTLMNHSTHRCTLAHDKCAVVTNVLSCLHALQRNHALTERIDKKFRTISIWSATASKCVSKCEEIALRHLVM